jgi:hypothetical protein
MSIRHRATGYSVEVRINGKRLYKGGFKTLKEAREYQAKLIAKRK